MAAALGAVLGLGVAPLAAAPAAHADVVEDVLDQILSPFIDTATGGVDWDALATPAAWDAFVDPAHWETVFADLNGVGAASAVDPSAWFEQDIYGPLHTGIEDWIHSDLGTQVDGFINTALGSHVIGDGTAGTQGDPTGGAGGWLFGDGGDGWSSTAAGVGGGDGGAAGIFGDGGSGGDGGAGAAGGDGGAGGSLFGVGGAGGDAGAGAGPDGLPALGGAGGDAGAFGFHGAVGGYGTLAGGTPLPDTGGLTTTDGWITDADGRVVILHGLNQVYKIPPYEPSADGFGADDAAFLEANGFNAVRLGVIWAGVEPKPGVFDEAYLASIAQTVQTLAEHHIRVILDFHQDMYNELFQGEGAPAWAVQTGGLANPQLGFPTNYFFNPAENHAWDAFWSNAKAPDEVGLENNYALAWEHVANYFKGNSDVAGYELINEPWPGSQALPSLFGSAHFDAQELTPFYNQVDSAIRAVDPNTPVFFEPNVLFNSMSPTHLGTVDDPHTVFAFHDYCIFNSTLGVDFLCPQTDNVILGNAAEYADSHDIPAFMTEFGATDNTNVIAEMLGQVNPYRIGWTEWAYTGHDITSSSPNGQALVFNPNLPPVGDNVDAAKLATLAEPYPQLVAGTPNAWTFDNGTFHFSYTTEMASGSGSFPANSDTEISVPAVEYPHGYQVDVSGGHVVSIPNVPVLVIASDPGASTVTVTVTGAAG